jgi:hypothetical protein
MKGWVKGVATGLADVASDYVDKSTARRRKAALADRFSKEDFTEKDIWDAYRNEEIDLETTVDLIKEAKKPKMTDLNTILEKGGGNVPLDANIPIAEGVNVNPYKQWENDQKLQKQQREEALLNRVTRNQEKLSDFPSMGANPVTISKIQEQIQGDIPSVPSRMRPKFSIPQQPQEFTKPIRSAEEKAKPYTESYRDDIYNAIGAVKNGANKKLVIDRLRKAYPTETEKILNDFAQAFYEGEYGD